jgi:hypothetical protein
MIKLKVLRFALWFCVFNFTFYAHLFAQDNAQVISLSKQIVEAKTNSSLYAPFEELSNIYYKDNKYSEFADFLKSLSNKNKISEPFINYYIALSRLNQLKYLEEKQLWDEYFAQGNNYREELAASSKSCLDKTTALEPLNIYARLLIWQFHKGQQDVFAEESLASLMDSVKEFAGSAKDLKPVKYAADTLLANEEKAKSKELYRIYAKDTVSLGMKDDELLNAAAGFFKEGNLELSQTLYDAYIARITKSWPKEKLLPALIDIAKKFAYKDEGASDALFAERLFKKTEELGGKEVFDQELMYLRAFNLEKAKEYSLAKEIYLELAKRFDKSSLYDEAIFKAGIINTYVEADAKAGKVNFETLAKKEGVLSSQIISSLYQLGLLSQWDNDFDKAKEYYNQLISKAADNFQDTVAQARERLKEIEENKALDYNLKTFLDLSLKENAVYNMAKSDLKSSVYNLKPGQEGAISSAVSLPESGCMQVELQYLWSGNTGSTKPTSKQSAFSTSYVSPGTKEINLVIVSPSGIIDRNIDLVDVH